MSEDIDPLAAADLSVDPLSDATRKCRTTLMLSNLVLFAVIQVGLAPTEITSLGIQAGNVSLSAIKILVWLAVFYFLLSFALMVRVETRVWEARADHLKTARKSFLDAGFLEMLARADKKEDVGAEDELAGAARRRVIADHHDFVERDWETYEKAYRIRLAIDAKLPIVVSIINIATCSARELLGLVQ